MPTRINYSELDKFADRMAKVPKKIVPIMRHTVYSGTDVVLKHVKEQLRIAEKGHGDPRNTKHLVDELKADKIESSANESATNVHFMGYDTVETKSHPNGKPQPLKAATLESGRAEYTRKDGVRVPPIKATHFYTKAMNKSRNHAKEVMDKEFNEWLENAVNEGD